MTNDPAAEQELLTAFGSDWSLFNSAQQDIIKRALGRRFSPTSGSQQMGVEEDGIAREVERWIAAVACDGSLAGLAALECRTMLASYKRQLLGKGLKLFPIIDDATQDYSIDAALDAPPVAAQSDGVCPLCSGSKMISPLQTCICAQSNLGTTPAESCRPRNGAFEEAVLVNVKVGCHKAASIRALKSTPTAPQDTPAQGEIAELRRMVDRLLAHCPDSECSVCGAIVCPYEEPLHFHHDGCPACAVHDAFDAAIAAAQKETK